MLSQAMVSDVIGVEAPYPPDQLSRSEANSDRHVGGLTYAIAALDKLQRVVLGRLAPKRRWVSNLPATLEKI